MPAGPAGIEPDADVTATTATVHQAAGIAVSVMRAQLEMGDLGRATLDRQQVAAWYGRTFGAWVGRVVGGGVIGGSWRSSSGEVALRPGWLGGIGLSRQWLAQDGWRPFLRNSYTLAASGGGDSGGGSMLAFDVRVGVDSGWNVGGGCELFGVGRVFGGPVWWWRPGQSTQLGGDAWHVQLGAGAAWSLPGSHALRPTVVAEVIALGEIGASLGLSLGF